MGFEIIVRAPVELLEKEATSLMFEFNGRDALMDVYRAKMTRLEP